MIGLLVSFALLSIVMVLAMVPLSIELIGGSAGMPEHRRRLRGLGGVGVMTEWLLPRALDQHSPRQFWAIVYGLCWIGLLALAGLVIATSEPQQRLHNLTVLAVVAGGWWGVHAAVVWLGRALNRTTQSARRPTPPAADPADDLDDAAQLVGVGSNIEEEPVTEAESVTADVATPTSSARSSAAKARGTVASALWLLGALLLIGLGDALFERSQTLQAADRFLNAHHGLLVGLTISLAVLGFVAFMGAILDLVLSRGQPMSREEVREEIEAVRARSLLSRAPVLARASTYRFTGEAVGAEAHDEWSLDQMKQAWRSGAWRRSRVWKRRFIVCLGVAMLVLGLFGLVIVIASWGIKLLFGLALLYAAIRILIVVFPKFGPRHFSFRSGG